MSTTIVLPMAGESRRFRAAGYRVPKHQLPMPWGGTLLEAAVSSFEEFYGSAKFVFGVAASDVEEVVVEMAERFGIRDFAVSRIRVPTTGQAHTVALALEQVDAIEDLYIFNVDSRRYRVPKVDLACDGLLEVFRGPGSHWSFVDPGVDDRVLRTTEKERISDLCSNGLYWFNSAAEFCDLVAGSLRRRRESDGELYVAPLYNELIARGSDIRYRLIDASQMTFAGTPAEYETVWGG